MNAEIIGSASVILGAGREKKDDTIDYTAGIILNKKTGDYVSEGEIIATLFTNDKARLSPAGTMLLSALVFCDTPPRKSPLIYKTIN